MAKLKFLLMVIDVKGVNMNGYQEQKLKKTQ